MIALIIKNWKTVLDIIIIVAVVLLIFIWNPLGIFGGGLKLQDSANMVSEVKEIGQLITAEYYGEVIASEPEASFGIIDRDSISEAGEEYYIALKKIIKDQYFNEDSAIESKVLDKYANKKESKIEKRLEQALRNLKSNTIAALSEEDTIYDKLKSYQDDPPGDFEDFYYTLLIHIGKNEHKLAIKDKKIARQYLKNKDNYFNRVVLAEVLSKEYDLIEKFINKDASFKDYLTQGFSSSKSFIDSYFEYNTSLLSKPEKKKEVAIIGRGSVKAGFDFEQLNENNFVYDESQKIIHFYGFKAKILNQDINPWFIPQSNVPGFQILNVKNAGFNDIKKVKIHCVEKLVHRAKQANIEDQAQKNGEEALQEFFSLILGENVKKVIFHDEQLSYDFGDIVSDKKIDFDEIILIDSIISKNITLIEKSKKEKQLAIQKRRQKLLRNFIDSLKHYQIHFAQGKHTYKYDYSFFNRKLPTILMDSIVSTAEIDRIARQRPDLGSDTTGFDNNLIEDSYWFKTAFEYAIDFNQFVDTLLNTKAKKAFLKRTNKDTLVLENDKVQNITKKGIVYNSWKEAISSIEYRNRSFNKNEPFPINNYSVSNDSIFTWSYSKTNAPSYLRYPIKPQSSKELNSLIVTLSEINKPLSDDSIIQKMTYQSFWTNSGNQDSMELIYLNNNLLAFEKEAKIDSSLTVILGADTLKIDSIVIDSLKKKVLSLEEINLYEDNKILTYLQKDSLNSRKINFNIAISDGSISYFPGSQFIDQRGYYKKDLLDLSKTKKFEQDRLYTLRLFKAKKPDQWINKHNRERQNLKEFLKGEQETYSSMSPIKKKRLQLKRWVENDKDITKSINDAREGLSNFIDNIRD